MTDLQSIGNTVTNYIGKLIAPIDKAAQGKSVGILVGVTIGGARYYFDFGQLALHNGGSGVKYKDMVLFIGSNTKVFTATLLALAAATQASAIKINLETNVANLLPMNTNINQQNSPICLWHLATHSAGFPEGVCGNHTFGDYPFTEMRAFLEAFQPTYAPGQYWVYSNQAFALLGALLSHAYDGGSSSDWDKTYQAWPECIMQQVVTQLNMPSTQVDYADVVNRVVQGYGFKGVQQRYAPVDPPTWVLDSAGLGAGALSSTLDDMLTFLEAQITPPSGTLGTAVAMTQDKYGTNLSMGLGWQIGNGYFDKNGGLGGYCSYMAFDPSNNLGLIVLGNTDGGNAGGALTNTGRELLGALRNNPALPSHFPRPPSIPECPS